MINLYFLNINNVSPYKAEYLSSLCETRRKKALSYRKEADTLRCISGGILMRKILGTDDVSTAQNGKPYLENATKFNLSHSGNYVVLAVSDSEIGVDIEHMDSKNYKKTLCSSIFSDKERTFYELNGANANSFYTLWTCKESYLKKIGTGIRSNTCFLSSHSKFYTCTPFEEYSLSICIDNYQQEIFSYEFIPKIGLKTLNIDIKKLI